MNSVPDQKSGDIGPVGENWVVYGVSQSFQDLEVDPDRLTPRPIPSGKRQDQRYGDNYVGRKRKQTNRRRRNRVHPEHQSSLRLEEKHSNNHLVKRVSDTNPLENFFSVRSELYKG